MAMKPIGKRRRCRSLEREMEKERVRGGALLGVWFPFIEEWVGYVLEQSGAVVQLSTALHTALFWDL